jgi:hypothetical protein
MRKDKSSDLPSPQAAIEASRESAKSLLAWVGSIRLALKALTKSHRRSQAPNDEARQEWVAGIVTDGQLALGGAGAIAYARDWLARSSPVQVYGVTAAGYHEAVLKLALALHEGITDALRSAWLSRQDASFVLHHPGDIPTDLAALWGEGSWEEFSEALLKSPIIDLEELDRLNAELDCERSIAMRRLTKSEGGVMHDGGERHAEVMATGEVPPSAPVGTGRELEALQSVPAGWEYLRDATEEELQGVPPPAAGCYVWVQPTRGTDEKEERPLFDRDGNPVVIADAPREEPDGYRPRLAIRLVDREGRPVLITGTDGRTCFDDPGLAPWLPDGWEMQLYPTGLALPNLEEWFRAVLSNVWATSSGDHLFQLGKPDETPKGVTENGVPQCPTVRGMVRHAHIILKHLGLAGARDEAPSGLPDRASYITHLEHIRDFLHRSLGGAPLSAPRPQGRPRPPQPQQQHPESNATRNQSVSNENTAFVHPDGPEKPCWLWWGNVRHELAPRLWQILAYLWDRNNVPVEELVSQVWGEEGEEPKDTTVRSNLSQLNGRLAEIGVPREYRLRRGHICRD